MEKVDSLSNLQKIISANGAVLIYFSSELCSVCKVLKPKIQELIDQKFPRIELYFVDCELYPEISANYQVFTSPTIILFLEGRETIRKSRAFSVEVLSSEIARQYALLFD